MVFGYFWPDRFHRAVRYRGPPMPAPPTSSKPRGFASFRRDLRRAWTRITARTSIAHTRLVLLLVLFGSVLRIVRLQGPVSYDEALTWTYYASRSVGFVLSNYTFPSNHVLHSLLVKCSTALFGVHLWSLRLPALLAGIAVMPLFYAFVRAMFNRYIALLALALVAAAGPLVEYSALARGYSLTWLFLVCALLAGRHFVKKDNTVSLMLVAVSCALGLWTVPSAVCGVVMAYVWLVLYLAVTYRSTLRRRMLRLGGSLLLCAALAVLLYAPLIAAHGLSHLFHHPALVERTWKRSMESEQDQVFALWAYFNDTAATWISVAGIFAVVYAAYTSSKYRLLLFALLLGAVPFVLAQGGVAPPPTWTYALLMLHLGSAIAVFYLLKVLQDRVHEGFTKRRRTAVAAIVLAAGMSWLGVTAPQEEPERFPEAGSAALWLKDHVRPGDRVWAEFPWEAPLAFHLACARMEVDMDGPPGPGGRAFVIVGPGSGQTLQMVLKGHGSPDTTGGTFRKVEDWHRLEIFAPR